jgi:hypothetical protein
LRPSTDVPFLLGEARIDGMSGEIDKRTAGGVASSTSGDIAAFLEKTRTLGSATGTGRGRLIFALDATMSRQPTWDLAMRLQGEMFTEAALAGGLDVQLLYYRGFDECRASRWVRNGTELLSLMTRITVAGGHTQIRKVLAHARDETRRAPVQAVVFVGDAMEEDVDDLCRVAGELGLLKLPCFMFQEGQTNDVELAFREIARLSGGAFCRFDAGAAHQLRALLQAVAAYAAGGRKALAALEARGGGGARLLLGQVR